MHGARLVSTPAMKSTGSAVSGLDDSWLEMCVKSTIRRRDAEEGCYLSASLFAMIQAALYFRVSSSSKRLSALGSLDCPSQNKAFLRISGSRFVRATENSAGTAWSHGRCLNGKGDCSLTSRSTP